MKKNIIIIVLSVVALLLAGTVGYLIAEKVISDKTENGTLNDNKEIEETKEDVYGYGMVSYDGYDSAKSYFKIVEFHKNNEDVVLASNNEDTQFWEINIYKNRLYFVVDHSFTEDYSDLMYVDLADSKREIVNVFNTKNAGTSTCRGNIRSIKVTDGNIYFINRCSEFYKYEISTKTFHKIENHEYQSITNFDSENYKIDTNLEKLYVKGKELILDRNTKELIYGDELIYTSAADYVNLLYSFEDDIVISERTACSSIGCNTFKYYKYDFSNQKMIEVDIKNNELYSKTVYYKK